MRPMPCVQFDEVSKRYDGAIALDAVTLALPEGAITAVVGASGSGKSTLLQHINGLLRPDAGSLRVFGAPIDYARPEAFRRRIGYAVQGVGLFPHLTVFDNTALLARLEGWPEQRFRRRFERLIALVGLPAALADRYPHTLSGGQQQRVGLCRALMLEPPLLLLDEPFSGADPITRREIHREFLRLCAEEPVSAVLVTHDMREALDLASYLVILRDGRVVQAGEAAAVAAKPANAYVSDLLRDAGR
ncbi:MAG: ATP-binding cassette domain-containing protein [Gammaproteobacteria bacterium]